MEQVAGREVSDDIMYEGPKLWPMTEVVPAISDLLYFRFKQLGPILYPSKGDQELDLEAKTYRQLQKETTKLLLSSEI
jgi:hypothetical protein